MLEALRAENS